MYTLKNISNSTCQFKKKKINVQQLEDTLVILLSRTRYFYLHIIVFIVKAKLRCFFYLYFKKKRKKQGKPQHLPSYQNKTKYHQKIKGFSSTLKEESDWTLTKTWCWIWGHRSQSWCHTENNFLVEMISCLTARCAKRGEKK